MQKLIRTVVATLLVIFCATALLTLTGVGYLWFGDKQTSDLPYLGMLMTALVVEAVGVVIGFAKRGFGYLPVVKVNRTAAETHQFMKEFIAHGSSVTIVSNRLAWLQDAEEVQDAIIQRANAGVRFEIITSLSVEPGLRERLEAAGVEFLVIGKEHTPEARFTLINANRSGAERLAIAKGTHPDHEITIFDSNSGPQIIGLAKDIVSRSRAIVDAA
jgi:hypothetical protein